MLLPGPLQFDDKPGKFLYQMELETLCSCKLFELQQDAKGLYKQHEDGPSF